VIRFKLTNEERNLELIGSVFCEQYQTEAKFYIERSIPLKPGLGTGAKHLVVQYGDGYTGREGLAVAACQSAFNRDPGSASKRDPTFLRFERLALAPSELVGVAETGRARVVA